MLARDGWAGSPRSGRSRPSSASRRRSGPGRRGSSASLARASMPSVATRTSKPARSRMLRCSSRTVSASSTTRMRRRGASGATRHRRTAALRPRLAGLLDQAGWVEHDQDRAVGFDAGAGDGGRWGSSRLKSFERRRRVARPGGRPGTRAAGRCRPARRSGPWWLDARGRAEGLGQRRQRHWLVVDPDHRRPAGMSAGRPRRRPGSSTTRWKGRAKRCPPASTSRQRSTANVIGTMIRNSVPAPGVERTSTRPRRPRRWSGPRRGRRRARRRR